MTEGILLVDKSKGITSYDVIRGLKRNYPKGTKIGHTGTLDPFATGLLIILIGRSATRLMNKFHQFDKKYQVKAQFGIATDTQDITGKIIKESKVKDIPTKDQIEELISNNLKGEILQTPPLFSAKKIKGKPAYKLAREGKDFKLEPKKIVVKNFEVLDYKYPKITFEISCTTGTYIRTLINDLGELLEMYATAVELRRTQIGMFSIKDCSNSIIETDKVLEIIGNEER